MISDTPNADDFYESGKELLGFAWETVAELLLNLEEAEYFGVNKKEVSDAYWDAAKRRLSTALSITQQGVELILKGRLVEISPFLLISGQPSTWPSPYEGGPIRFPKFRTVDAQDLARVHDTFSSTPLSPGFIERFVSLREKRNTILHSVDKSLNVPVLEVIDSILFIHKQFFPAETWGELRCVHLLRSPDIELGSIDYVKNRACREICVVVDLLKPAQVKTYFRIDKKQRRYFCPNCYDEANHDVDFEYKLAVLRPKGRDSTEVYCPICNCTYTVSRDHCEQGSCPGNVISTDFGICLTCGR